MNDELDERMKESLKWKIERTEFRNKFGKTGQHVRVIEGDQIALAGFESDGNGVLDTTITFLVMQHNDAIDRAFGS